MRENRWGSWHPYLPFLGDEVTGKTIAVIGTGRIGQAMISKCSGFEMNVICYDAEYRNEKFVASVQKVMDLRHELGISRRKNWIRYAELDECLREADYVSSACAAAARGRGEGADLAPHQRAYSAADEEERVPGKHFARSGGG